DNQARPSAQLEKHILTVIRAALPDDAAKLCALWNLHITQRLTTFNFAPKEPQDLTQLLVQLEADAHGMWLAEDQTGLLGFAFYHQFRGGIGYAHSMEHTIYLADGAAGRGLGRRLLGTIENHARHGGAHVMMAGVSAANP